MQQFGQDKLEGWPVEPAKTAESGPVWKTVRAEIAQIVIRAEAALEFLGIGQTDCIGAGKDGQKHGRPMGFTAKAKVTLAFRPMDSLRGVQGKAHQQI